MRATPSRYQLAEFGRLLAEPARAAILLALADGRARPAGELARMTGIAPSTASEHLRRLLEGGLLAVLVQGRHRYFHVADDSVVQVLEALPLLQSAKPAVVSRCDAALHFARSCYRHLAGQLGVAFYACLRSNGWIDLGDDAVLLSASGARVLTDSGLLSEGGEPMPAGRQCLDWTERRFHLGGLLGVALTTRMTQLDWLRPRDESRALRLTPPGHAGLAALGLKLD